MDYHQLAAVHHDAKARVYARAGFGGKAHSHKRRAQWHLSFGEGEEWEAKLSDLKHKISLTGDSLTADDYERLNGIEWNNKTIREFLTMFTNAISRGRINISGLNVSKVTDMSHLFLGINFDQDISGWDVRKVTKMSGMFKSCKGFNRPLEKWDVSNVTHMSDMFEEATSFNQPLNDWNVSNVENMYGLFFKASSFNQPLDKWDVGKVTDMNYMFHGASSFNHTLPATWNTTTAVANGLNINMFEGSDGKIDPAVSAHFGRRSRTW